ncbi:PTS ascorbate transporter subunit IIA [Salmonella enterica subsp. enterica serovar Choleraesuis]|nr:PTS ascorbate transporter subunit IIA [Salmonella enterica subsp. enterica serovar Choleraesuis]
MSINALLNQRWNYRHRAMNWRQAVLMASQPLVGENKVDAYYPLHVIDNLKNDCDNYMIEDGVMVIYAKPEQGVTSKQGEASVLRCRKPVIMPNGREVTLIVMISAGEQEHTNTIRSQIHGWLVENNCCEKLIQAASPEMLNRRVQKALNIH